MKFDLTKKYLQKPADEIILFKLVFLTPCKPKSFKKTKLLCYICIDIYILVRT